MLLTPSLRSSEPSQSRQPAVTADIQHALAASRTTRQAAISRAQSAPPARGIVQTPALRSRVLVARAVAAEPAQQHRISFAHCQRLEDFVQILQLLVDAGKAPKILLPAFVDLYTNYSSAILNSGLQTSTQQNVVKVMGAIADRVLHEFVEPYTFPVVHKRLLQPYDYYAFGQNYVRNLVNFRHSFIGSIDRFTDVQQQLEAGENVILLANHQTEADPGVFALLLEASHPTLATEVIYVAGDRVISDPLCKPFSMGRNLYCVYSKKHMDDIPELRNEKMASNRRAVGAMLKELSQGGRLVWIAPSGGRDRPDAHGNWVPDKFDPTAVELMRHLAAKSGKAAHFWPFAMLSHRVMPPPSQKEKALGERRLTHFSATGIALGEELIVDSILEGISKEDKTARQAALASAAYSAVAQEYAALEQATQAAEEERMDVIPPHFSQPFPMPALKSA